MKELVKYSRVTGYLEKLYRELNHDKFNGELEEPVITIQSTPRAYGHVTVGKVWKIDGQEEQFRYELNIGAGTLDRPIENVVSTLLHEMVHIYHLQNGIQDCSRGGTYHNKKFKEKAESVGLIIDYDKKIGWSITSPSEELIEYIISKDWQDIRINRNEYGRLPAVGKKGTSTGSPSTDGTDGKKPSSTRKYVCPCCGASVRATRTLSIVCGECADFDKGVYRYMVTA